MIEFTQWIPQKHNDQNECIPYAFHMFKGDACWVFKDHQLRYIEQAKVLGFAYFQGILKLEE